MKKQFSVLPLYEAQFRAKQEQSAEGAALSAGRMCKKIIEKINHIFEYGDRTGTDNICA